LVDLLAVVDPARAGDWADRLIATFGGLAPALAATPARLLPLVQGDARAVALIVAHRRATLATLRERAVRRPIMATRYDLLRYLHQCMAFEGEEALRVFFVNARRELIAEEVVAHGGPATIAVEPRQVIVRALALAAAGMVLVHNHPGGDPAPSAADRRFTRTLSVAAECLGIAVHDHLIVARDGHHRIDVIAID
jgi:DNA repair protein RadC